MGGLRTTAWSFTIIHEYPVPKSPKDVDGLMTFAGYDMMTLICHFLFDQKYPDSDIPGSDIDLCLCPWVSGRVSVYCSAIATYYAPSDLSGIGGVYWEQIWVTPAWNRGESSAPRYNCILVQVSPEDSRFSSMQVVCVWLFFSIKHDNNTIPCALVEWYETIGNSPDKNIGIWVVKPEYTASRQQRVAATIHLNSVVRGVHLIPVYRKQKISHKHTYSTTLNNFQQFYVNKYIDYHAFKTMY